MRITGEFEREARAVLEDFLARVMAAATREVVRTVELAFGQAGDHRMRVDVGSRIDAEAFPRREPVRRPTRVADVGDEQQLVVAQIREVPGSTVAEVSGALGVSSRRMRRHLRILVEGGRLRMEERSSGFGGPRRRVYFVAEPVQTVCAAPREVIAPGAEATA